MIAATLVFSSIVALLITAAALAFERIAQSWRLPRRGVWALALLTSWVLPLAMMVRAHHAPARAMNWEHPSATRVSTLRAEGVGTRRAMPAALTPRWPVLPGLDEALGLAWAFGSGGLLLVWSATAVQVYRRARAWPVVDLDGVPVSVTDGFGPAALGYLHPRIVMPHTVFNQPVGIRMIALRHEQAHIQAGDPLLLLMALALVVLAPWNIGLWWQFRRLRFAIEVDCDARVLKGGVAPSAYGETLLAIGQQCVPAPLGIVTLIDPTSQLERRIRLMFTKTPRHSLAATVSFLVLAISFGACAAQLDPPVATRGGDLLKSPPGDSESKRLGELFAVIVEERYPRLMHEKANGTPVVNILFKEDGTVDRASYEIVDGVPEAKITPTVEAYAGRFGMAASEVAYAGIQDLIAPATGQRIVVAFTERKDERKDPNQPFVSHVVNVPDTRSIDRALAERYFPDALKAPVPDEVRLWVLLDNEGHVLRTGEESSTKPELTHVLEVRYPGIETQYITATAIAGDHSKWISNASGKPLQIFCVWLKKGSPLPTRS